VERDTRDHADLLRGYVDVVMLRDVIERHEVSHPVALRWMVRHLLGNAAGTFTVNKFYNDLKSQGLQVAKDTLHHYLKHLEDAFLIRTVSILADSERQRMVNPRKIYPIDPGLISLFDRTGRANLGHALETCVMLELERRGAEIYYIRNKTGTEVDFCARYANGKEDLIQVSVSLDAPAVREREVAGLRDALKEHSRASAHLIVLEPEPVSGLPKNIRWHAASQWLLHA
jgi:predicted AAA+ superfamily ATPase